MTTSAQKIEAAKPPDAAPRQYAIAFGALMLMVLAVFWRWVFTSDVPYVRDIAIEHFPRVMELRSLIRSGNLPYWNPWEHCGEPVAANPIYMLFYPTTWLIWILPPLYGFKLHYVIHFFLLAAGGFLLARRTGLKPFSCWAAGALLVFSGPALSLGNFYNMLPTVAWIPFVILGADYQVRNGGWKGAGLFAAVLAPEVLGAEPATSFSAIALAFAWCIAQHGDVGRKPFSPANRRVFWRFLKGSLLAAGFGAAQIFPVLHHLASTPRGNLSYEHATFWSLHPLKLIEILVPEIWGNALTYFGGLPWIFLDGREPFLLSVFIGIVPVALALAALVSVRTRTARFWGVAAVVFLLVAIGRFAPFFRVFYYVIPIFRVVRFPIKLLLASTIGITQLAAIGVDHLLHEASAPDRRAGLRRLSIGIAAFGMLWLVLAAVMLMPAARAPLAGLVSWHFGHAEAVHLLFLLEMGHATMVERAVAWLQIVPARRALYVWLAAALMATLLYRRRSGASLVPEPARRYLVYAAAATAVLTLIVVNYSVNPVVSRRFFEDQPPVTRYLIPTAPADQPVRIFAEPTPVLRNALSLSSRTDSGELDFLPPPAQVLYAFRMGLQVGASLSGFEGSFANDPQALLAVPQGQMNLLMYEMHLHGPPLSKMLQLSSVEYALFTVPVPAPGLEAVGTASNGTARPVTAYRVPNAKPRAYLAEKGVFLPPGTETMGQIFSTYFDESRDVVLWNPAAPEYKSKVVELAAAPDNAQYATIRRRDATRVDVETSSANPSYLVLTDSYYPDWRVTVDGQPATLLIADQIFRGVELPAGKHQVVFRYIPWSLYLGMLVSALSIAAAIMLARRERPATAQRW